MPQVNLNLQNWVLFTFFTTVTALIPSGKSERIVYYADDSLYSHIFEMLSIFQQISVAW